MDKTLKVLENALQSDPENWETRRHLVELLYEQGEGEQAGELLTEAPEIPATEEDQLFAAQVFLEHDAANAMLCIDAVLKQNSGSAAAHLLKAHFYRQTNQKRNAGKHYTTATVLDASLKDPELADWLAGAPAKGADEPAATAASAAKASPPPVPKRARGKKKGGRQETKPEPDVEEEAVPAIEETAPEPVAEEIEETVEAEVDTASVSEEATPVETETGSSQPALATGARASVTDQAAERIEKGLDSEKKQKSVLAFGVALLLHVLLAVAFYKLVIQNDGGKSPDLVISAGTGEVENEARMREFQQNIPQKPSSSSDSRRKVITSKTTSPIALPEVDIDKVTDDPIGAGDSFGFGTGWGDGAGGSGGGTVQFFGDKQKAKRVVYIVDFSYSMMSTNRQGNTRIEMLKKELVQSVKRLSPALQFNVIYFSGTGWIGGETATDGKVQERLANPDPRVRVPWISATKENRRKVIKEIEAMPVAGQSTGGGTMWAPPTKMAMKMRGKPDLIYLLTDGAAQDSTYFLRNLDELNESKIPIHTTAMELPGEVAQSLIEIADRTGGKFSIVLEGKLSTGEGAKKYADPKYNPQ